jgi:hypothetical protein
MIWYTVQHTGMSDRSLVHQAVEDKTQFAVGMYHLLPSSLSFVFWVQDILVNAFEEKQDTWKWQWKEETDKQWTDNRQSQPCAPLIQRITAGGGLLWPHTTPQGRTAPSTSWLKCKMVITGLKLANKYSVMCSAKDKPGNDLNIQIARWCFVLTWIRCYSQNCNMGLCFSPCLSVFHTKSQFSGQNITGRGTLHNCKYHFSFCINIFLMLIYFIQKW